MSSEFSDLAKNVFYCITINNTEGFKNARGLISFLFHLTMFTIVIYSKNILQLALNGWQ